MHDVDHRFDMQLLLVGHIHAYNRFIEKRTYARGYAHAQDIRMYYYF